MRTCLLLTCFPSRNEEQLYGVLCTFLFGACGRQNAPLLLLHRRAMSQSPKPMHMFCYVAEGPSADVIPDSVKDPEMGRLAWITHMNPNESLRILTKRETGGSGVSKDM